MLAFFFIFVIMASVDSPASLPAEGETGSPTHDAMTELASGISAILDRIAASSFPLVQPSEQTYMEPQAASDLVTWLQKTDAVELQSYIDEQWRQYRSLMPTDEEKTESVRHAEWAREFYYKHLQDFDSLRAAKDAVFDALRLEFAFDEVKFDMWHGLQKITSSMGEKDLPAVLEHIKSSWTAVWSTLPAFLRTDEASKKQVWFAESCVSVLQSYAEQSRTPKFQFMPELAVESLDTADARAEAMSLVSMVLETDVPFILKAVDASVQAQVDAFPAFMHGVEGLDKTCRHAVLKDKYFEIVATVLAERRGQGQSLCNPQSLTSRFQFMPELAVESLDTADARAEAMSLVSKVLETDVPFICRAVDACVQSQVDALPAFMRGVEGMDNSLRQAILKEKYFEIVGTVLAERRGPAPFVFSPELDVESLPDENARGAARDVVARVQSRHVSHIQDLVHERFAGDTKGVASTILETHGPALRSNWMLKHYFDVVRHVVSRHAQSQPSSSASSLQAAKAPCGPSPILSSPKKRARTATALQQSASAPVKKTIAQLHTESLNGSDAIMLQAVVLDFPSEPRWATVQDRKSKTEGQVAVVSVLLFDGSGPIILELWREQAERALRDLLTWSEESENVIWMDIQHVWCRGSRGKVMPAMHKLVANERTVWTRMLARPEPSFLSLSPSLYIAEFQDIETAPPFTVNIRGTVGAVLDETSSQSGNPMRNFQLQDQTGRYVLCTAFGRHVDNTLLVELNEVVLFFAKAMGGLNQSSGSLWMYDDSHVVFLSSRVSAPPARKIVELR